MDEAAVRVDLLAIPAQQGANRKRVSKVMQSGRRNARGQVQAQFGKECVERLTNSFRTYTTTFGKRNNGRSDSGFSPWRSFT